MASVLGSRSRTRAGPNLESASPSVRRARRWARAASTRRVGHRSVQTAHSGYLGKHGAHVGETVHPRHPTASCEPSLAAWPSRTR